MHAVSNNIANVNTRVSTARTSRSRRRSRRPRSPSTPTRCPWPSTSPGISRSTTVRAVVPFDPQITSTDRQMRADKMNVDVDQEMAKLSLNAVLRRSHGPVPHQRLHPPAPSDHGPIMADSALTLDPGERQRPLRLASRDGRHRKQHRQREHDPHALRAAPSSANWSSSRRRSTTNAQGTIATLGTFFSDDSKDTTGQAGVDAVGIVDDPSPDRLVYAPMHPDADPQGYVHYPNVGRRRRWST